MATPSAAVVQPTIHEAELESGPTGAINYGPEITEEDAIHRRRKGLDIVVRGLGIAPKKLAEQIERSLGFAIADPPHTSTAGPLALPHYHQASRNPGGHCFYETDKRKARRKR